MADLKGISPVLSDRQPITQRLGVQGISPVLSDRQPITLRVGFMGIGIVLADRQGFDFSHGFNAVTIEGPNNEQWFEPMNGMKSVNLELDNPVGNRILVIKK